MNPTETAMATAQRVGRTIDYPESDGKPMAETDIHRDIMVDLIYRLKARYEGRDAYVSGNLLVYYVEGDPRTSLAPDCFVVFGVRPGNRRTYKTWEEGKFPAVVFEITSRKTKREDQVTKFEIYRDIWKVKELFLFDPTEDYLKPSLIGYRMSRGELKPIKPVDGKIPSKELGITLERDGTRLLLREAATGEPVMTAAEAEVARLRKELDALRKKRS